MVKDQTVNTKNNSVKIICKIQLLIQEYGVDIAKSQERATTGHENVGLLPAAGACSLLVGSVSVQCDKLRWKSLSPCSVSVWQQVKMSS